MVIAGIILLTLAAVAIVMAVRFASKRNPRVW